jgi:hypothetical protein
MLQWKEENKFTENPTDVLKFTFSPGFLLSDVGCVIFPRATNSYFFSAPQLENFFHHISKVLPNIVLLV